jgi:ubiquitin C-terminal hydrolase
VKLKTFLEIPQELDLSPYVAKDSKVAHTKYELKAVVVHLGTECSGGHYIGIYLKF